jgi:hypothetical protein
LEVVIGCIINLFRALVGRYLGRVELVDSGDKFSNLIMSFISYFWISLVLEIAQVLYRNAQLLFAQVRPVKHLDFLVLQSFWRDIKLSELVVGMLLDVFLDR